MAPGSPPREDVVGDRARILDIGFGAVFVALAVFALFRLAVELATGRATPWWGNAGGAVALAALYRWYRVAPERRSGVAVHGIAAIATIALLVPTAYGMSSSKWWLALVGFAALLMGRRAEALTWAILTLILVPAAALIEPYAPFANARGEPAPERAMAGFFFVAILLGITWSFRRVAARRARELTETAQSLTRANQVKSRFLAHMSHDVRTPLHAVIAMTDLALAGELAPAVREQIETARDSAQLLLSLLNNILDVTRAEADAIELDARPFALHEALGDALRPLAAQARARGLELAARAEDGIVEERVGDRVRLTQIVINLAGNALKFTKEGRIDVRVRAAADDADRIVIEVADTGAGIPKERQAIIFEPFAQAHAADAGLLGGAGLGLAIVRELAQRMDGGVKVESEPRRGATFTVDVRLPRAPGATRAGATDLLPGPLAPPSRAPTLPPEGQRVLVCEDNAVNRKVLLAMLERLGHTATVADDGAAAWALLAREPFDVLVTDVEMPGLDGIELDAPRARPRGGARRTRVAIVGATAHVGGAEQHRLLAAGMDAHLGKPFTLADLHGGAPARPARRALAGARRDRRDARRVRPGRAPRARGRVGRAAPRAARGDVPRRRPAAPRGSPRRRARGGRGEGEEPGAQAPWERGGHRRATRRLRGEGDRRGGGRAVARRDGGARRAARDGGRSRARGVRAGDRGALSAAPHPSLPATVASCPPAPPPSPSSSSQSPST